MRARWWVGAGVLTLSVMVAAGLVWSGKLKLGAGLGKAAAAAAAAPAAAASAPLEFRANEVIAPFMAAMPRTLQISGPLVAPNTVVVRAKAAGTLLSLNAAEGTRVSAGQALGRIDVTELSSRVAERQAMLESSRAAFNQAQRSHLSNEGLAAQSFISAVALDASRAQLDSTKAGMVAAQAALDSTRVGLRDAAPLAPISGVVAKRHALPGERVAMEQPLLTLVDLRTLELAGSVGTHEVASLRTGMALQVKVEGVAKPVPGRLARIAPAAEAGTRAIGVTIELANPGELLRAGQYALAEVELADDLLRLVLPLSALSANAGQSHVWVIDNGLLVRRVVTTGRLDEARSRIEIVAGLAPGAQVLAARFDNLREGARALVVAAAASPLASANGVLPVADKTAAPALR